MDERVPMIDPPNTLTEFPPLSPEEDDSSGLGYIFNRFFKRQVLDSESTSKGDDTGGKDGSFEGGQLWKDPKVEEKNNSISREANETEKDYELNVSEGRSLPNVLRRVSNLLALKNTGRQSYNDTELKQYWMPDSVSKECYDCGEKFTTFRRRHHCRVCGQIFCSKCCNQEIPGKIMNCTGDLRVCMYCGKVVLSYLQSSDMGAELSADLRALQDDLLIKFGSNSILAYSMASSSPSSSIVPDLEDTTARRKPSLGYQEEKFANPRCDSGRGSLKALLDEAVRSGGVVCTSHRYRLRTYHSCFTGGQLVDWFIMQNKAANRLQGIALGQTMVQSGYLECVSLETSEFLDGGALFRILHIDTLPEEATSSHHDSSADSESEYVASDPGITSSTSIFNLNLNLEEKTAHLSKPLLSPVGLEKQIVAHGRSDANEAGLQVYIDLMKRGTELPKRMNWDSAAIDKLGPDKIAYETLKAAFTQHCSNFLKQMLNAEGVSQSWGEYISPLAWKVVETIHPDLVRSDDMDIRQYVQIKKVPGGERRECQIISGVVCSKNVAHRAMPTKIVNPRILLLNSAIMYQRIEEKFVALEPIIMQEQDYVTHTVAKIASFRADIVLVGKCVCRLAQEALLALGVCLVLNVKPSILDRISRVTGAEILNSVDPHVGGKPRLGTCKLFHLNPFNTDNGHKKTLMMFEGCPLPKLGCTIMLRGGSAHELAKIKKVASCLIFAYYNSQLEFSYLMDSFADPPKLLKDNFFDDSHNDSSCSETLSTSKNLPSPQKPCLSVCKTKSLSEDKLKVNVEAVHDFSDPLHSYLNHDDDSVSENTIKQTLSVSELPFCNKFRKALEDNILSVSPYLKFNVPYLESECGRNCPLRLYFGKKLYYSSQFSEETMKQKTPVNHEKATLENRLRNIKLKEEDLFVKAHLTQSAESNHVKTLVAMYRACGGRIPLPSSPLVIEVNPPPPPQHGPKDVLDPVNHQRLPVLFCSYSPWSQNSPAFCVDPWIVDMELYGRNDIPLGAFLEKYCFRSEYFCPSVTCDVSMLQHTRRFVHHSGAVHITLRTVDVPILNQDNTIYMWNWCHKCSVVTPLVGMSSSTWSMSFAKYLELCFHGDMYTARSNQLCSHSLHQGYTHYFALKNTVASFSYSPVAVWEICLPPLVLHTEREFFNQNALMDDLKTRSLMGNQVFSSILNKLCSTPPSESVTIMKQQLQKDCSSFKQRVEETQMKLSSPSLDENNPNKEDLLINMWAVEDSMVLLRRSIAESVEEWNLKFSDAETARRKEEKKKATENKPPQNPLNDVIDGVSESLEESDSGETHMAEEAETAGGHADNDDVRTNFGDPLFDPDLDESDTLGLAVTDTKPIIDKKSVKTILSQLLPTSNQNVYVQSPMNQNEHYCLPLGAVMPVVVYEREPSSIIAYALNSHDYRSALEQMKVRNAEQSSPSPSIKLNKQGNEYGKESVDCNANHSLDPKRAGVLSFWTNSSGSIDKTLTLSRNNSEGPLFTSSSNNVNNINTVTSDSGFDDEMKDESKGKSSKGPSENIEVQFSDSTANFKVKVYFAEDFNRLRSLVLPEGEEGFIRSLTRCVRWAASGGKSGSNFNKTKDDRFILKEMSKLETHIFINFAPQYFTYMETCVNTGSPTLLGKILGVYRIIYRNVTSNTTFRSNLLVMEHLFHARTVTNKFDLKGSMRNRLVIPTNGAERETVLLDENLINMTCDSPLYILPHSKTILMKAIHNDTQFLAMQSVMDYSLLVGLDHSKRELVVGIIDYIRTFTWDKKLETMVKRLGQGKQPTIISPDEYRERFIAAMHRYFLPVPDRWTGLGKGID